MNISDMYSEDILNGSVYMHTHSLNTQNMISWIYIYICIIHKKSFIYTLRIIIVNMFMVVSSDFHPPINHGVYISNNYVLYDT